MEIWSSRQWYREDGNWIVGVTTDYRQVTLRIELADGSRYSWSECSFCVIKRYFFSLSSSNDMRIVVGCLCKGKEGWEGSPRLWVCRAKAAGSWHIISSVAFSWASAEHLSAMLLWHSLTLVLIMSGLSEVSISFTSAVVYAVSGLIFALLIFLLVLMGISNCDCKCRGWVTVLFLDWSGL